MSGLKADGRQKWELLMITPDKGQKSSIDGKVVIRTCYFVVPVLGTCILRLLEHKYT